MSGNLLLKFTKEKLTLIHENNSIKKSAYLENNSRILNGVQKAEKDLLNVI